MSKAQGRIRAQLIGDRANHIQLRSGTAAPQGVWRPISVVGFPAILLFVLVLGLLQRDAKVPEDCVIDGVPTRPFGTDGSRLHHRTCPL
jgi:hypothetical protein